MRKIMVFVFLLLILVVVSDNRIMADIKVGQIPQDVEDVFRPEVEEFEVSNWVTGLEIPWQLIFLPDSERALVTERPGRIRLIKKGQLQEEPYAEIDVAHIGEGGLLGMTVHPQFPEKPYIYIMYTYRNQEEELKNRVVRLIDQGDHAEEEEEVIWDDIPGGRNHNGGRIAFGPDDMLYITTGDTFQREIAQQKDNLGGKILRITASGEIPTDNPFSDSPVYSLGHRNPQGLAWHPETDELFISDHGPSGEEGLRAKDMVKVIAPGGNYGWPRVIGYHQDNEYRNPLIIWEPSVPPSGATFYNNELLIATLRSEALINIKLEYKDEFDYQVKEIERWFASDSSNGRYGRLRDIVTGPDGALYLLTSNRDGRGSPQNDDDRILRLSPISQDSN